MVELDFRVFLEGREKTLQKDSPEMKKDLALPQSLDNQSDKSGEYRNRTDDLLTASEKSKLVSH